MLSLTCVCLLTHCTKRPNLNENRDDSVNHSNSTLQIQPLVPDAVKALITEAQAHLAANQEQLAILNLKRALQISPNSPLVQQELAEIWLTLGEYQQALNWSKQVIESGPEFGSLCERSRRTLALAAEQLGDVTEQAKALESIAACQKSAPPRF